MSDLDIVKLQEKLKRCPFDGEEADLVYNGESVPADRYEDAWTVVCCHCGATPICDDMLIEDAIAKWNARAGEKDE